MELYKNIIEKLSSICNRKLIKDIKYSIMPCLAWVILSSRKSSSMNNV